MTFSYLRGVGRSERNLCACHRVARGQYVHHICGSSGARVQQREFSTTGTATSMQQMHRSIYRAGGGMSTDTANRTVAGRVMRHKQASF